MPADKKKRRQNLLKARLLDFARSIWFFPVIGLVALVLLTSLKISGTSIGVFYHEFYANAKDPNLIIGAPRSIRSDEWESETADKELSQS